MPLRAGCRFFFFFSLSLSLSYSPNFGCQLPTPPVPPCFANIPFIVPPRLSNIFAREYESITVLYTSSSFFFLYIASLPPKFISDSAEIVRSRSRRSPHSVPVVHFFLSSSSFSAGFARRNNAIACVVSRVREQRPRSVEPLKSLL